RTGGRSDTAEGGHEEKRGEETTAQPKDATEDVDQAQDDEFGKHEGRGKGGKISDLNYQPCWARVNPGLATWLREGGLPAPCLNDGNCQQA
ncbi:MAG TPA: hypothetical protein VJZ25_07220, partial [Gemmatimonadaceae bacterium]|nr:hypothetical protein [Gemmatimonadaceae bacterium]